MVWLKNDINEIMCDECLYLHGGACWDKGVNSLGGVLGLV